MARMTEDEKSLRKALVQHLWHMHGEFGTASVGPHLDLQTLEKVHDMMHTDGYACPPHEHKSPGPYDLGKIKLTLGKKYIETIVKVAGGDLG